METTIAGYIEYGIEYGVYGDLLIKYPKPYSIYLSPGQAAGLLCLACMEKAKKGIGSRSGSLQGL